MSHEFTDLVWHHRFPASVVKLVALRLADRANAAGESFPSIEGMAEESGFSRRYVQRALRWLSAQGYLRIATGRGPGHVSRYSLIAGRFAQPPAAEFHEERDGAQECARDDEPPAHWSAPMHNAAPVHTSALIEGTSALVCAHAPAHSYAPVQPASRTSALVCTQNPQEPSEEQQQLPREVCDRLEPLRNPALGLDLEEDLPGWIRTTDGLDAGEVQAIVELRHRIEIKIGDRVVPFRYPTHFGRLRAAWEGERAGETRRRVDAERAAKRAGEAAATTTANVIAVAATPVAPDQLDQGVIDHWPAIVAACRPGEGQSATSWKIWLASDTVHPLGVADEVLWLHVPTPLFDHAIRDRFARVLALAAGEALGQPIRSIACQINGHGHLAAAGLPVAVAS